MMRSRLSPSHLRGWIAASPLAMLLAAAIPFSDPPRTNTLLADMNCDTLVNILDVNPFVLALSNPAGYAAAFPTCKIANGDINGDGALDILDVNPFIVCVQNNGNPCP
ncbi:hypothetical protein RAS1_01710 [Phycisphaerae bacterium RAS1]|nr:hypothetical protein RAS1_01710 [Phycisphaerae bacterium RAS1]